MTGRAQPIRVVGLRDVRKLPARVVVAAVRPERPNPAVVATAADAAQRHDAHLLVLGTMRHAYIDYSQLLHCEETLVEEAGAELFAHAVELLYDRALVWSSHVVLGHPARHINELGRRCDLRGVVTGSSTRRRHWWRKLNDHDAVVVTA